MADYKYKLTCRRQTGGNGIFVQVRSVPRGGKTASGWAAPDQRERASKLIQKPLEGPYSQLYGVWMSLVGGGRASKPTASRRVV